MKPILLLLFFLAGLSFARAADTNAFKDLEMEKLYQRFLKEMRADTNMSSLLTNIDSAFTREMFSNMVVHPSFGIHWDEVPAPTMTNSNAMDEVNAFIATNGWNMQTNNCAFDCWSNDVFENIRGLPWTAIHGREFPAVTHNHILYVMFTGWHHNDTGVAYNPLTNAFVPEMQGFKPIGQHWYVCGTSDSTVDLEKIYEGQQKTDTNKPSATSAQSPPK